MAGRPRHTTWMREIERIRERREVEQRKRRRLLAADRRLAALVEVRKLGWPRLRINGQRVEGEAAWRALLGDPQTDIRAVEEALANFRCLLEVRRAALP